jgi:predicted O-methyltransferase YrrM
MASQPPEGVDRVVERLAEWRDRRAGAWHYDAAAAPEETLHRLLGAEWPCEHEGFETVWSAALEDLHRRGLEVGRGAFGGWDDGDVRLARLAWCLTRELRPQRVVETGVARGLTTRTILEALQRTGSGRLWSIDLPPLIERELEAETAAAVPDDLRDDWTFLRGSSRRLLPGLVAELGTIDLFVHDSMHTTRNVRFELALAWGALAPGGALLVDDVEQNRAFGEFLRAEPEALGLIAPAADSSAVLIGVALKPAA